MKTTGIKVTRLALAACYSCGLQANEPLGDTVAATGGQYKPAVKSNVHLHASWNNGGDTNIGAGFVVGW